MIGLALYNYHDTYGSFPPAYIADKDGKPMHSWRVLILPFLEKNELYKQYRFDEPWHSPHNIALATQMPPVFRCPGDLRSLPTETSYLAIVGTNTAWPGVNAVRLDDVADAPERSLHVVEAVGSGVHWLEPRDLDYAEVELRIAPQVDADITSDHGDGVHALMMDGRAIFLNGTMSEESVRRLIEINDGKDVGAF
jgi:hypothetical protein